MQKQDRRVARTRAAVDKAVGELLLTGGAVKVADIVDRADVGRSTFYDHFTSVDDAVRHALARPFGQLADAIAGGCSAAELSPLLRHFWENRRAGRAILWGTRGRQSSRLLTDLGEAKLIAAAGPLALHPRLVAAHLAEGALGMLRGWIAAEASGSPDELAAAICRASQAAVAAMGEQSSTIVDGAGIGSSPRQSLA